VRVAAQKVLKRKKKKEQNKKRNGVRK